MTAQAKELPAERIDSRIYADRFAAMTKKAAATLETCRHLLTLVAQLPPAILDGEAAQAVEDAIMEAGEAVALLADVPANLEDMAGLDAISAALWRAVGACRYVANIMDRPFLDADELRTGAAVRAKPSDLRSEAMRIRESLSRISAAWVLDAFWIKRLHAQAEQIAAANDTALRAKRMRARRRAGLTVYSIEVHDSEIRQLQYAGLLPKEGATQDDIRDAVQSWFMASLAAINPHEDRTPATTHSQAREGTMGMGILGFFVDVIRRRYGPPA